MFAVLRVAVVAVALALAFTTIAWLVTGERRWRQRTWVIFRYSVFGLTLLLLLFAGEALLH